jgi:hypothetical protein
MVINIYSSAGTGGQPLVRTGLSLSLNTWTHYAWSLSGTTGSVYVNGTFLTNQTGMTPPPATNRTTCYVGYRFDLSTDLSGFDEIKIYNRSLSAAEITTDYSTASFITLV